MKHLLLILLFCTNAIASPITTDEIYSQTGLKVYNKSATFNMPSSSLPASNVVEEFLTQSNHVSVTNKVLDGSSNAALKARVVYDVPTMGGTSGANIPLNAGLPAKAWITKVWFDVVTPPVGSAGSPTIGVSAATGADVLADTAIATYSSSGLYAAKEDGVLANSIKLAGATGLTVNVKAGSLSAGKIVFFIDYAISK